MPSDDDVLEEDHAEAVAEPAPQLDMSRWNVRIIMANLEGRGANQSLKCTIAVDTSGMSSGSRMLSYSE